jgi:sugar lactone lactonase YvrE
MKRKRVALGCIVLVVIVVAVGAYIVFTLSSAMSRENITQTVEIEGCRFISGVIGPEDFEYLPEANGLVVSSLDRRAPEESPGGLYWIDLAKPPEEQFAEPIVTNYPADFKPHGLTFQPTEEGGRLFVISHPETGEWPHTIEVFSLASSKTSSKASSSGTPEWEHVQTLTDDALISPNDLVALPDGSLFISNDFQGLGGVPGLLVDMSLGRKRAPLVYYDGTDFTDLDANVLSSAGITAVKEGDNEYLYRDMMNKGVEKLEVHWDQSGSPRVELVETIQIDTAGADNFTVDEEGAVYVATHYSFGLLTDHAGDENALSPTQIFEILPNGEATLIYANKGEEISAGSVGTVVEDRLFIGQIFNDGILSCPIPMDKKLQTI